MPNLSHLNIRSFARLQAVLLSLIGVILGVLYAFGGAVYDMATVGLNSGTALAFLALIGMPALFFVVGYLLGVIEAILFNLIGRRLVSIDFVLDRLKSSA